MMRKTNLLIMGILTVSMLFAFTPEITNAQTRSTIKIGALGPLTIQPGDDMKKAADLAVKEINAGVGVDVGGTAYNFELITETTSNAGTGLPDATVAATNLQKLITVDEVVAVLGGFRTEVVLGAVQPTINASGTPFLGVGSTSPIITEYYYRVGPPNGTTLARNLISLYGTFLKPVKNVTSVVLVREDAAWTSAIGNSARDALAAFFSVSLDNTTVAPIPVTATGSDIAATLAPVVANTSKYQAIMTLFSSPVGAEVTKQWAALGLNEEMYLAGINVAAQQSTYFTDTGGAAAGEIYVENAPDDIDGPTNKSKAFRDAYTTEYNAAPTYTSFAAYDAVYILKDAIERSDLVVADLSTTATVSAKIQATLPSTSYLGVSALIAFTSESSAGQVASPAVPAAFKIYDNAIVHDLFTPSTIGVSGFPYAQLYFSQWQENGSRAAVWAAIPTGTPLQEPPFVVDTTTTTSTSSSVTSSVSETSSTIEDTSETDEGFVSGFEWFIAIFATTVLISVRNIRRNTRKD